MVTKIKPRRMNTSSPGTAGKDLEYQTETTFDRGVGGGDMKYADFNFQDLTDSTVILDLSTEVTPTENFVVIAPSDIKEGQIYVLRVNNGATVYSMGLAGNTINPYSVPLTLTANATDQFVFLAVDGKLELQKNVDRASSVRGGITGTLSNQADLQNALNKKQNKLVAGTGIAIDDKEDYSAMQGPCPVGYHIPSREENAAIVAVMTNLGITTTNGDCMKTYLKMPYAGYRNQLTGSAAAQGIAGRYWSYLRLNANTASVLAFQSNGNGNSNAGAAYGMSIRPFKDEAVIPTSSWTTLFDGSSIAANAGIFHNTTDGIISISADGINRITIADKNLGATVVYNDGDTLAESNCGKYYQHGNNYGFPWTGTVTTSSTQVDTTGYGPGNYYNSSTFITVSGDWSSVYNSNLRGGDTGIIVPTNIITNTGVLSVNGNNGNVIVNDTKISSTAPSSPTEGMLWYNTINDVLKSYDGTNRNNIDTKVTVEDNLTSTSTTNALSANQGRILNGKIADLMALGKFLSLWNAATGQPVSFPYSTPYAYSTGDYFLVSVVDSATPPVNYRPTGSSYTGTASSTTESDELEIGDVYIYDGSVWLLQSNHGKTVTFANIAGQPTDNTNLATALGNKQDTLSAGTGISISSNTVTNTGVTSVNGSTGAVTVETPNTKTFYLSSTSDLINAQNAYDWYAAGKNAIIVVDGQEFFLAGSPDIQGYRLIPGINSYGTVTSYPFGDTTRYHRTWLQLTISSSTVTLVVLNPSYIGSDVVVLDTNTNYTTPYQPQYDGSPATKKYVDDHAGIQNDTTGTTTTVTAIWAGTQAEYDALGSYSSSTIYHIY